MYTNFFFFSPASIIMKFHDSDHRNPFALLFDVSVVAAAVVILAQEIIATNIQRYFAVVLISLSNTL